MHLELLLAGGANQIKGRLRNSFEILVVSRSHSGDCLITVWTGEQERVRVLTSHEH